MESLSIVGFKNKHTVFVSVFCLGLVLLLWFCPVCSAAEPMEQEQRVAERFWEILVKSPKRGTTFDRVYNNYVDTGHAEQLVERCRNLTQQNSDNAKAWLLLGLVAERRGDTVHATDAFQKATQFDAEDSLAPFYLGETLIAQGRLREAIDALEQSVQRKPGRLEIRTVLQTLGKIYERFGETQKSADVWNQLEELFPDDPDMLVQIAELQESEGRFDDALKRYEKLIEKTDNEFARVRFSLAAVDIKLRQGKEQAALVDLDGLLDHLAPESWLADSVRNRIDRIFVRKADEAGLAGFYRKRYEKHPADFESVRRLVLTLRQLGKAGDAEKLLTETIEKTPSNIPLRLALIDLFIERKNIAGAAEQFQAIDRLSPNNVDYLSQWGQLVLQNTELAASVREAEAVKIWTKIADAAPDDPVAAITVADLFLRNKIPDEAEKFYRKAAKLRSGDASYQEYLAMFYHSQHQKEKVLETLQPLAEGDKRTAENLTQLGNFLLTLNYVAESFEAFRSAAELAPNDLQTQWRFTEALIRQGKFDNVPIRLQQTERLIETDEQFETFLQQEVQFLKSSQKLAETASALEKNRQKNIQENIRSGNGQQERSRLDRQFWRIAAYRQAEVKTQAAVEAINKALNAAKPAPSNRLLRYAAELFEQNGDGERAAELYENLVEHDTVWRVDHLKQLTALQIKLGRMEQAVETGRQLMGLGAGNSGNIRFYADLLLGLGRRDEAIEILRQALRAEPGDHSTLTLLAQTLADAGRDNEAIGITWRLFERTDHLSGKLGIIETLCDYYQRLGQIETLIDRLQNQTRLTDKQNEASICLAKVFETVSDFDHARQTLENLLDKVNENETNNPMLLKQLVSVAEKQDDIAAAIRFQELLCQKTQDASDTDKLFTFYIRNGNTEKANKLFLSRILQKSDLQEQLDSIDLMIRREQYDAVTQVLNFLEIHEAENWQVPFRRLAVDSYTGQRLGNSVQEFRKQFFPLNPQPPIPHSAPIPPSPGSQIWLLPGNLADQKPFEFVETAPDEFLAAIWQQREFFATLFRDHLRRNERFSRQNSPDELPPPKPFLNVETFRDARFLALGWLIKDAIDKDLKEKNVEFAAFQRTVNEIRTILSENALEKDIRLERLRFEIFLLDLALLDDGRNPLAGEKLKAGIDRDGCNRTVWNIVRNFGIEGDADWRIAAFQILLAELIDERIAARFNDLANDEKALENRLGEILDENCQRRGMTFHSPGVRSQLVLFALFLVKQANDKAKYVMKKSPSSTIQKIDKILEIWNSYADSTEPAQTEIFERKIAVRCPMLVWILKTSNRQTEIAQIETSLEKIAQRNPSLLAELAGELGAPFDDDMILFLPLTGYEPLETQLKRLAPWIRNAVDFCSKSEQNEKQNIEQRQAVCDAAMKSLGVLLQPARYDHGDLFNNVERKLLETPTESLRDLLSFSNQMPSARSMRRLMGLEDYQIQSRRILNPEHLSRIDEMERGLYVLVEFVLKLLNDLQLTETPNKIIVAQQKIPDQNSITALPKPLSNYQPELVGERIVDRPLLRSLIQDNPFYAPLSPVQEFFFCVTVIWRAMDSVIGQSDKVVDNKFVPLRSRYAEKFRQFLEEKEQTGTAADRKLIADLRNVIENFLWTETEQISATKKNELDQQNKDREFIRLTEGLEIARKKRSEQGKTLDTAETLALALLKVRGQAFAEIVPILDTLELKSPQDAKTREFIAAHLGIRLSNENSENKDYRERTDLALNRLLDYRLSDQEAFHLLPLLEKWERRDDAQTVLDRLVVSTTDRRIQNELLHRMQVAGEKQKENAIAISLRVLRNPGFFSDSRHFALDSYIYETALKILRDYHKIDTVAEQLEVRFKGLKDKTDSRIMLANLYIAVDRLNEAKELAVELSRNPSRETDRRTAVTSLLQRFDLKKELEEMNERLLDRNGTPPR